MYIVIKLLSLDMPFAELILTLQYVSKWASVDTVIMTNTDSRPTLQFPF